MRYSYNGPAPMIGVPRTPKRTQRFKPATVTPEAEQRMKVNFVISFSGQSSILNDVQSSAVLEAINRLLKEQRVSQDGPDRTDVVEATISVNGKLFRVRSSITNEDRTITLKLEFLDQITKKQIEKLVGLFNAEITAFETD